MFSTLVTYLCGIYFLYYLTIILWDGFLKPQKTDNKEDEETVIDVGQAAYAEEAPQEIREYPYLGSESRPKESPGGLVSPIQPVIAMEIETQGIPVDQFLKEGRDLFSGVDFSQ